MSDFSVAEGQRVIDTVMVPWLDDLRMTVEEVSETGGRGTPALGCPHCTGWWPDHPVRR